MSAEEKLDLGPLIDEVVPSVFLGARTSSIGSAATLVSGAGPGLPDLLVPRLKSDFQSPHIVHGTGGACSLHNHARALSNA